MKTLHFISGEHANILVLLVYEEIRYIAEFEGMDCRKIVKMKKEALLCLRTACGERYKKEHPIDPLQVFCYMAQRCNMDVNSITCKIDEYISEYWGGKENEYWSKIPRSGDLPTAAELLAFLYANYDCNILLLPYGMIL